MNVKRKVPTVNLRERVLKSGRTQLFLDICIDGKRVRESLNLFLEKGNNKLIREKNRETMSIAMDIAEKRQRKERDIANGLVSKVDGYDTSFFKYYDKVMNGKTKSTRRCWKTTLTHLHDYEPNEYITFRRINRDWVEGFCSYLKNKKLTTKNRYMERKSSNTGKTLSQSSIRNIMANLIACINSAEKEGLIDVNVAKSVEKPKLNETERNFLTKDELKKLLETNTKSRKSKNLSEKEEGLRRTIKFSFFTGLRISDCLNLRWSMISVKDGRTRITFRQEKTKGLMYLDINAMAASQLGEIKNDDSLVFSGNPYTLNRYLKKWVEAAGIKKKITFHCCRHTFATLALQAGADIYTTSKLLGHTNISTTQIYAKIVDQKKQEAVDLLENFIK